MAFRRLEFPATVKRLNVVMSVLQCGPRAKGCNCLTFQLKLKVCVQLPLEQSVCGVYTVAQIS